MYREGTTEQILHVLKVKCSIEQDRHLSHLNTKVNVEFAGVVLTSKQITVLSLSEKMRRESSNICNLLDLMLQLYAGNIQGKCGVSEETIIGGTLRWVLFRWKLGGTFLI